MAILYFVFDRLERSCICFDKTINPGGYITYGPSECVWFVPGTVAID